MNILDLARSALPNASGAACTPDGPTPAGAHYRWRVILADRTAFEVCCLPELTAAEMRDLYRSATVQPMADASDSEAGGQPQQTWVRSTPGAA